MNEQESGPALSGRGGTLLRIVRGAGGRVLRVEGPTPASLTGIEGATDGLAVTGPLSPANAAAVRELVPALTPQPVGLSTSAGTGDRLGLATPGHARAFRKVGGISPVFAQQSIREMDRLGRSPRQVLDDATFGALEAGWTEPVGADADHLTSVDDAVRCLEAGYATFTLDPGHLVGPPPSVSAAALEAVPWTALEDDLDSMLRRYARNPIDLGPALPPLSTDQVRGSAARFGEALAECVRMYRALVGLAIRPIEVEIAIDEIDDEMSAADHAWFAIELRRLGVEWIGFAPRFTGRFEKGVDYRGDLAALARDLEQHASIARALGPYKLSLHSGSDKYRIYELAASATEGLVHLKTSGTSYLCALEVIAVTDPELFREAYRLSRDAYRDARASYHVSARFDDAPEPVSVPDADLPELLERSGTRQILHVGYAAVLGDGMPSETGAAIRRVLETNAERYASVLEAHLERHLRPFRTGTR